MKKPKTSLICKLTFWVLLFSASAKAQIQKTEPPFWYAGMKNPELQIMFYGKNISQYEASVSNNVVIKNVEKTENPNYLFVTIDTKDVKASELVFSFKIKNKVAFTQKYALKERRANSADRKSYDSSDLIYLIMPDRFANENPKNDSNASLTEKSNRQDPGGRHGGDVEGIIKNLDYISSLGATTIWNTPLCEDNEKQHSYHTYAQTDVYRIDPRYGTNEDYARLSAELHKRDMKLVMDYVTNHWGISHWMVKDLPTKSWINQFENYTQTHHRREVITDIHASESDQEVCIDGWFVPSMPDLNLRNPLVAKYLTQNAIWWIEFANLDGFRVDTYNYSDKTAMANWAKSVTNEYPNFNIVGEIWMNNQANLAFWQKDSKIGAIENYNSNLPSVMDFTLQSQIGSVFNENEPGWDNGLIKLYNNFAMDFLYPNTNNILVFAENHDTDRMNHTFKYDLAKYKLAMTLLATVRGIPQIYYGSEIGMGGDKAKGGDADIRQDFPGGWAGDKNNAFTAAGRTAEQAAYFDFSSKLFNWRKSNEAVHSGKMTHYIPENNTYVYFRFTDAKTVMVVFNNNAKEQIVKTNRFKENIKNYKSGKDVITGKTFDLASEITLEPKSALVLELE
ncbi:glycoside hydrolase family 13 protein [Flavobacterium fluviatile]|uniref:glycoside hydrolase family 13 protein n=1 Tax=Flavobacterium fluviatile TaxID=1862387 RepID=UPI0013D81C33|nr:glycoside hydrolase family 13 protein [Flavobacterium fluviatile]